MLFLVNDMEWFKFYGGAYLSDPKMLMLTACERSCWLTLLSYASVAESDGLVKYLTEPQLMTAAGVSPMHEEWDYTKGVLDKFEGLGMVSLDKEGGIQVLNWAKRQESYLSNAERQKQYRERVKERSTVVTTPLQHSNARIEENRIDIPASQAIEVKETKLDREGNEIVPKVKSIATAEYEEMVLWLEEKTGVPIIRRTGQYKHLALAKQNSISRDRLKARALELMGKAYYQEHGIEWGSVLSSFDRKS